MNKTGKPRSFALKKKTLQFLVLICVSILAYLILVQTWSLRDTTLPLAEGDVAQQDLQAPASAQFVSDILTEQARSAAERDVAPVYIPPDPSIARGQIESLTSSMAAITAIRSNAEWTLEDKQAALSALPELSLQPVNIELLAAMDPLRWDLVQAEALTLLDRVMRGSLRTESLDVVRDGLAGQVSYTLTESESQLVVELLSPLVVTNSFYSPELTDAARQAARNAVEPVIRSFVQGQTVVRRGQVISAADLEALSKLGLIEPTNPLYNSLGAAALVALAAMFITLYTIRRQSQSANDLRSLLLLAFLFVVFLAAAQIAIPDRTVVPYLFPVPAFGLLVSALFGMERGMILSLLMGLMASYGMPDSLALFPYYTLSSLFGVIALGPARQVKQFFYAVVAISVSGMAVVAAYRLAFTELDWIGIATLLGAAAFMAVASASLALPLHFLLAQFLGLTTPMQLLEISRPDSPLLNYFLQRAPGTYQHSLQVANLAEQAAERIHADALLTRVGTLFHDIGKANNPLFFVENQPPNQIDSHDDMDPLESAEAIIRHVTDGFVLAKKYRLPRRLQDFIGEHHGTLVTRYQYNRAVQAAGGDPSKVDESRFRYPGPSPRSKETALLMFADGVEARARAERPANDEEMYNLVRSVIENRRRDGQLNDTPLTQRDLTAVTESFVATLRVTYHPRLEYPKDSAAQSKEPIPVGEIPTVRRKAAKRK
jgi:putative nucleotidyltransferase with HDIG domain